MVAEPVNFFPWQIRSCDCNIKTSLGPVRIRGIIDMDRKDARTSSGQDPLPDTLMVIYIFSPKISIIKS